MDYVVPANHRVNNKKTEKGDKYLDLARELRRLMNMTMTMISNVIGTLETVPKSLEAGSKGWKLEDESRPSKL